MDLCKHNYNAIGSHHSHAQAHEHALKHHRDIAAETTARLMIKLYFIGKKLQHL